MPEDGKLYEAIDGELCVTAAPKPRHQWISANLFGALHELLVEPGHGWNFTAPIGVDFPDTEEERKLYERQGVPQYWFIDSETDAVEVWDFAAGAVKRARHTDRLPVGLGGRDYGEIDLSSVFPPAP